MHELGLRGILQALGELLNQLDELDSLQKLPSLEDALTSGEEVELVCVGPEDKVRDAGLRAFGVMTTERSVRVVDAAGVDVPLAARGYDHFA